ncbi:MAG: hypothetical protein NTV21_11935 [Planctomycetota bacterium]|nr:hypothetical protein [Planctomycetota bacterium]
MPQSRRTAECGRAAVFVAALAFVSGCGDRQEAIAARAEATRVQAERDAQAAVALQREETLAGELATARAKVVELEQALVQARNPRNCEVHGEELTRLRNELAAADERRLEREREWLRFLKTLDQLGLPKPAPENAFVPDVPEEERPKEPEPEPIDTAKLEREAQIGRQIAALLAVEGVRGLDLLEHGHLGDGWIGPVLFRVIDARGRLAGSLYAERLRLEGSRAARTLVLVMEGGYEMRGGERIQFGAGEGLDGKPVESGVRRLVLDDCDPTEWLTSLPELAPAQVEMPLVDDGKWSLVYVKGALNRLLRQDAAQGYWRVKSVNGVLEGTLREVHLEGFDAAGKLDRRVFADRLRLVRQERGFLLELEDGAQMRGDEKVPFFDGRFRIFLPRAVHAEWDAAVLPGLAEPDEAAAPPRQN